MVTRHYSFDERGAVEGYDYALPDHLEPSTIEERAHYNEGIDTRVHEINALMDFLQTGEGRRRFGINSDRFHLMGHSFGAGTMAALACRDKERVASCVLCELQCAIL